MVLSTFNIKSFYSVHSESNLIMGWGSTPQLSSRLNIRSISLQSVPKVMTDTMPTQCYLL